MQTTVHEIADGVYRLSTTLPDVAPGGFVMNQYLVDGDEPLVFHTGPRRMFPLVSQAAAKVVAIERLRWVSFGHVESDECGAMNEWLAAAPRSQVLFNGLGCMVSLDDLADRPPQPIAEGDVRDLGGHRVRAIPTPHFPHGWEAQVLYDETTGTLLCGDLLSQAGCGPAITTDDIVARAIATDEAFDPTAPTPLAAPTLRRLAALAPRRLATMHGSSFEGDGARALLDMAGHLERRLQAALARSADAGAVAA